MSLKIICGPAGSGKTKRAIDEFIAAMHRGDNPVFLAPTRPDALHFQRRILRSLGSGNEPGVQTIGRCTTVDSFCKGLFTQVLPPESRVIEEGEKRLILRDVIDNLEDFHSIGQSAAYPSFVKAIGGFIGEIEVSGAEMGDIGAALREWAGVNKWRQGLTKDVFRTFDRYEAILRSQDLFDGEAAQRRLLDLILDGAMTLEPGTIVMDGFWDFTPFQFGLVKALAGTVPQFIVTLPLKPQHPAYAAPAYEFQRLSEIPGADVEELAERTDSKRSAALLHLADNLFREDATQVPAEDAVVAMEAAGSRGQAELVAKEILELWRGGQDLNEIAVVTRGIGSQISTIAAVLEEFGVPFELSAPQSLSRTTLGRSIVAALDFAVGKRPRQNLLAWLRSPFSAVPAYLVDEFDCELRMAPIDERDLLISAWNKKKGRPRLKLLSSLISADSKDPAALANLVLDAAAGFLTAGQHLSATSDSALQEDVAALKSLQSVCEQMASWQAASRRERKKARVVPAGIPLLRGMIEDATVRLASQTNRNCVRLLDPHRILNQRFDIVFVCGLLEKQFPSLGREDSIFSDSDRRQLRGLGLELESGEQRLDEEKFLYFRTLSRARRRIYLCYPYCDKDGKETIPSLFLSDSLDLFKKETVKGYRKPIDEVVFEPQSAPTGKQALCALALGSGLLDGKTREAMKVTAKRAGIAERLDSSIACGAEPEPLISDDRVRERLASLDSFRITELQDYLWCPFMFFIKHVLEPRDLKPQAHNRLRGQLMHQILFLFGEQMKRSRVHLPYADADQLEEAQRQMEGIIGNCLSGLGDDLDSVILETELKWQLERFIKRENRCKRPLEYYDFELSFGAALDGKRRERYGKNSTPDALPMDGYELRGRIDRVDLLPGRDVALIIDYKSSKEPVHVDQFRDRLDIQIPLYIIALKKLFGLDALGGEYYMLRGDQRGGMYRLSWDHEAALDSPEVSPEDFLDDEAFETELQNAVSLADRAVAGIRAASFPRIPVKGLKVCDWCYEGICRGLDREKQEENVE